jgi:hypothetical protein
MSVIGTTKYLERNRFFNGQRLFASDLQSVEEWGREMRWLHNQTLHQPGIGSGLAITGAKRAREVTIQPGYAIDAAGREIVLTQATTVAVPPVADDGFGGPVFFDLVISYPSESDLKTTETRDGICVPRGAIRLREAPVICWVPLGPPPDRLPTDPKLRDDLQQAYRLRLARAQILNCQLDQPLSLAQRRSARPAEQPYVACGKAGDLDWAAFHDSGFGLELRATIDTSAAGFRTTPSYQAHVLGERAFNQTIGNKNFKWLLDGFVTLKPRADGFDFSLLVPEVLMAEPANGLGALNDDVEDAVLAFVNDQWTVEWMGVEG